MSTNEQRRYVVFAITQRRPHGFPVVVSDTLSDALAFVEERIKENALDRAMFHDEVSYCVAGVELFVRAQTNVAPSATPGPG